MIDITPTHIALFDENYAIAIDGSHPYGDYTPATYTARLIANQITDAYLLVEKQVVGNYLGDNYPDDRVPFRDALQAAGIKCHAVFNTFKFIEGFPETGDPDHFADIYDETFPDYMEARIARILSLSAGFDGVCLDFVRTDDASDEAAAKELLAGAVSDIYAAVKADDSSKIVSCIGKPWSEPSTSGGATGRDCTRWAREGYMDLVWCLNYGNNDPGGARGDPPNLDLQRRAQAKCPVPCLPAVSCYQDGTPAVPSEIWDAIPYRFVYDNYMIYTGWLFAGMENVPTDHLRVSFAQ